MKNLYGASLIILLVSGGCARNSFRPPECPQPAPTWQGARDYFLGPGRDELRQLCDFGREINSQGYSFFDPMLSQKITGMKIERPTNEAYVAGKTAAMYEVCPDVK